MFQEKDTNQVGEKVETQVSIENSQQQSSFNQLTKITPLSKYLALLLFISLPFIGAYVGYQSAPEKVVEKVMAVESEEDLIKNKDFVIDKIIVSANPELDSGDYIRVEQDIINDYVFEGKELYTDNTKIALSDNPTFSDLKSKLMKIDSEYVLMSILYNPSGSSDYYIVHEPTHKVIKQVDNIPKNIQGSNNLLRGVWYGGKNYYISGNDVVESDYLTGKDKILYTESDENITLTSECGVSGCWGNMMFDDTVKPALIVARYNASIPFQDIITGKVKSEEYFHDAIIIELP